MAYCRISGQVVTLLVSFCILVFYMMLGAFMFTAIELPHESKEHNNSLAEVGLVSRSISDRIFNRNSRNILPLLRVCYDYQWLIIIIWKNHNCQFLTFWSNRREPCRIISPHILSSLHASAEGNECVFIISHSRFNSPVQLELLWNSGGNKLFQEQKKCHPPWWRWR